MMATGSIFNKYRGIDRSVSKIDAAFVWSGNGRTYLFSGAKYYRYNDDRQSIDPNYPKDITRAWKGVPAFIDSVFIWTNGVTYFFKGEQYFHLFCFEQKDQFQSGSYWFFLNEIYSAFQWIFTIHQLMTSVTVILDLFFLQLTTLLHWFHCVDALDWRP